MYIEIFVAKLYFSDIYGKITFYWLTLSKIKANLGFKEVIKNPIYNYLDNLLYILFYPDYRSEWFPIKIPLLTIQRCLSCLVVLIMAKIISSTMQNFLFGLLACVQTFFIYHLQITFEQCVILGVFFLFLLLVDNEVIIVDEWCRDIFCKRSLPACFLFTF